MKHIYDFPILLLTVFALFSCSDNPDTQVIRSFYSEYYASCGHFDETSPVVQKYCSEMLIIQLDSLVAVDTLECDPFLNTQDTVGFNADSITIENVDEDVYRVFGSTVSDTVVLRMNRFHKIDRILSIK